MYRSLLSLLLIFTTLIYNNVLALTISQCKQPDGSIEFSNQGCSKSNQLQARRVFSQDMTQSYLTKAYNKHHKQKLFKQAGFISLQNKMLAAQSLKEMEKHAQTITKKVNNSAQQGKLYAAYDMVAATYVKLSKHLKKKHWEGQKVSEYTYRIRTLFEDILITQSTTSTGTELTQVIQSAWKSYQNKT